MRGSSSSSDTLSPELLQQHHSSAASDSGASDDGGPSGSASAYTPVHTRPSTPTRPRSLLPTYHLYPDSKSSTPSGSRSSSPTRRKRERKAQEEQERKSSMDPLRRFENEVSSRIFRELDVTALARCKRVSKRWNRSATISKSSRARWLQCWAVMCVVGRTVPAIAGARSGRGRLQGEEQEVQTEGSGCMWMHVDACYTVHLLTARQLLDYRPTLRAIHCSHTSLIATTYTDLVFPTTLHSTRVPTLPSFTAPLNPAHSLACARSFAHFRRLGLVPPFPRAASRSLCSACLSPLCVQQYVRAHVDAQRFPRELVFSVSFCLYSERFTILYRSGS